MSHPIIELERFFDQCVQELEPYDACAWLGHPLRGPSCYSGPGELKAGLAEWGIPRALVSHPLGELPAAVESNQALAAALAHLPGLSGVMTLLPEGAESFDSLEEHIEWCLARGMRAARILPKSHRYTLKIPAVPPLLAMLERRGIALFIPIGQTHWDEIGAIGRAHPKLAIFVEGTGHHEYLNMRGALSWLEAVPNLLVPTNRQLLCGGLELLVRRLGAHRVLFATNQPIEHPAAALSLLALSNIPPAARRQIAHQNITRLLECVGQGGYFA